MNQYKMVMPNSNKLLLLLLLLYIHFSLPTHVLIN